MIGKAKDRRERRRGNGLLDVRRRYRILVAILAALAASGSLGRAPPA